MEATHSDDGISLSVQANIRGDNGELCDPDIDRVVFTVVMRPGRKGPFDSLIVEKALLKFAASHILGWATYVRDSGMKTL